MLSQIAIYIQTLLTCLLETRGSLKDNGDVSTLFNPDNKLYGNCSTFTELSGFILLLNDPSTRQF